MKKEVRFKKVVKRDINTVIAGLGISFVFYFITTFFNFAYNPSFDNFIICFYPSCFLFASLLSYYLGKKTYWIRDDTK
jgi:ABC-type thiamin/hydroxymethylpyrimidine transport system permease subunit